MPRKLFQVNTKYQSAQGMVEFALVLPILLLLLFGIIGFGHLFFSYSLVVNASREAARAGSAVGLTNSSVPRYRDCDEIRANAVRVGTFAGVENNETSVQIHYDKGPKADGSDAEVHGDLEVDGMLNGIGYNCPQGGVGPGIVGLGDRIVVTVTVDYEPIVPLVNIPAFPITAVSRRTIVLGMPVGDAKVADAPACIGTITRIIPSTWAEGYLGSVSLVGEAVSFDVEVIADVPSVMAPGRLYLYIDDDSYSDTVFNCTGTTSGAPGSSVIHCEDVATWPAIGEHLIRARFEPNVPADPLDPCFQPSRAEPIPHSVNPAYTTTTILSHSPEPSVQDEDVLVEVQVVPNAPGGGTPEGDVTVYEGLNRENFCMASLVELEYGIATGSCTLAMTRVGDNYIYAVYDENEILDQIPTNRYYFSSHTDEPEPIYTGTQAPEEYSAHEVTAKVEPTPEPIIPDYVCPFFEPFDGDTEPVRLINFPADRFSMELNLHNEDDDLTDEVVTYALKIASIRINWPETGTDASLVRIMIGSEVLYQSNPGDAPLLPPSQTLTSDAANWTLPRANALMTVDFSYPLSSDKTYSVTIQFEDDPYAKCGSIGASGVKVSEAVFSE